jgi:xyloglucan-specific exo-beta-1,4-glucanase
MYDIYGFTHHNLDVVPTAFFEGPRIATVSIDYAELLPSYMFRVGQGSSTLKSAGYSTNGGTSWTPVTAQPAGVVKGEGTCAVNSTGKRIVWSPGDAAVSYTINNGKTWAASTGIPARAIVESDRVNENKFYAFYNGTFYVSTNGGASFTVAATGLPAEAQFKAVPGREGHIWLATLEFGLYRSVNSGATFTKLTNVDEADNIGFGKAATGQNYMAIYSSAKVGGVRGIYRSDNEGATWVRVNDDQHQYGWTGKAITGDPRVYGRVYVATNGRGIIYGDIGTQAMTLSAPATTKEVSALSVSPNPVRDQEINLSVRGEIGKPATVRVTNLSGKVFHHQMIKALGATSTITLSKGLQPGIYIIHVTTGTKTYRERIVVD